jgi:hypothetical protein
MVKLVDMPDLGSGAARRVGSSPIIRTKPLAYKELRVFLLLVAKPLPNIIKKAKNYFCFSLLFCDSFSISFSRFLIKNINLALFDIGINANRSAIVNSFFIFIFFILTKLLKTLFGLHSIV